MKVENDSQNKIVKAVTGFFNIVKEDENLKKKLDVHIIKLPNDNEIEFKEIDCFSIQENKKKKDHSLIQQNEIKKDDDKNNTKNNPLFVNKSLIIENMNGENDNSSENNSEKNSLYLNPQNFIKIDQRQIKTSKVSKKENEKNNNNKFNKN